MALSEGATLPDLTLTASDGSDLPLRRFVGAPLVLYFYPKDDTPGCTREACGFRDASKRLAALGAIVLGVSRDSAASHATFREKYGLPFALLVDADHAVAEKYGAWRQKTLYGKTSMGIVRSTFVIDAGGRVAKVFRSVKPDGHADQVIAAIEALA